MLLAWRGIRRMREEEQRKRQTPVEGGGEPKRPPKEGTNIQGQKKKRDRYGTHNQPQEEVLGDAASTGNKISGGKTIKGREETGEKKITKVPKSPSKNELEKGTGLNRAQKRKNQKKQITEPKYG